MRRRTIFWYANHILSPHYLVVICNFDAIYTVVSPHKTNPELIVNPYAMLSLSIILKGFQHIARWNFQRIQRNNSINLIELSLRHSPDLLRAGIPRLFGVFSVKNILSSLISE